MHKFYSPSDSRIAGKIVQTKFGGSIQQVSLLSTKQKIITFVFFILCTFVGLMLVKMILASFHLLSNNLLLVGLSLAGFSALVIIELLRILQGINLMRMTFSAVDPIVPSSEKGLRVAILTTCVPSKEPIDILEKTLSAMKKIRYNGHVDVWILDEGNSEEVKNLAHNLGVKHFSRFGIEKYNQLFGEFKAKTKAGNHNAWRAEHETEYDVVAQMDPDHIPFSNFLTRTLGYFRDPDVGFVVAPQVYGNQDDCFVAKASAAQAYIFHGIIQRAGNAIHAPLLIGTNHLYRTSAWKQINGYQDSIIEDHLTSMKLHSTSNPATNKYWKGVYTPDILSVGEGPTSWSDYFNQQKRWAYGIWEILLQHDVEMFSKMNVLKTLHYLSLQMFYPSVALTWLLSFLISLIVLVCGITFSTVDVWSWSLYWFLSLSLQIGFYVWIQRFNLNSFERTQKGFDAMLLTLLTAPIYTSAAVRILLGRSLAYVVTAKGKLRSVDSLSTYQSHMKWMGVYSVLLTASAHLGNYATGAFYWSVFTFVTLATMLVPYTLSKWTSYKFELRDAVIRLRYALILKVK